MVAYRKTINRNRFEELQQALVTGNDAGVPVKAHKCLIMALYKIQGALDHCPDNEICEVFEGCVAVVREALRANEEQTIITLGRWAIEEIQGLTGGQQQ